MKNALRRSTASSPAMQTLTMSSIRPSSSRRSLAGIRILHDDRDIIVVEKPCGLLTVATDHGETRTAYYLLTDYVRKGCIRSRNRVFIVHRLDRETSGLLVFAKHEAAQRTLQDHWETTTKHYLAGVHGTPAPPTGTISSYLAENPAYIVYATSDHTQGKVARTDYRVIQSVRRFSLLEIAIMTGRKHQIRVHLANLGHPVVGDNKYGNVRDGYSRLALHAWSLSFDHPHTGQRMTFTTGIPSFVRSLMGNVPPTLAAGPIMKDIA